ncbi:MAG: hypothetical protein ABGW69_00525 [Nanoarchaeota archaeon]
MAVDVTTITIPTNNYHLALIFLIISILIFVINITKYRNFKLLGVHLLFNLVFYLSWGHTNIYPYSFYDNASNTIKSSVLVIKETNTIALKFHSISWLLFMAHFIIMSAVFVYRFGKWFISRFEKPERIKKDVKKMNDFWDNV